MDQFLTMKLFSYMIPTEIDHDLTYLEDNTGMSRAEIFRRAIALYKRAKQTEKDKGNVILRNSDGTLREVIGF